MLVQIRREKKTVVDCPESSGEQFGCVFHLEYELGYLLPWKAEAAKSNVVSKNNYSSPLH